MNATILERNKFLADKVGQLNKSVEIAMGFGLTKKSAIDVLSAEKQKLHIALNGVSQYSTDSESEEIREWFVAHAAVIEQLAA